MKKYVASVSFGKDSLAMLLKLLCDTQISLKYLLDVVVFFNTGWEFEAILAIRDKVKILLAERGIEFVELEPEIPFYEKMMCCEVIGEDGSIHYGYDWCGGACRWGTMEKIKAFKKYFRTAFPEGTKIYEYIGIAADEKERIMDSEYKCYPLVEWGMTELDCLRYCYSKGFTWQEEGVELYSILDRLSCWCCTNKNIKELRNYYRYLPKYWKRLKGLQTRIDRPFKRNRSIFDLEQKFKLEENLWCTIYQLVYQDGSTELIGCFGELKDRELRAFETDAGGKSFYIK